MEKQAFNFGAILGGLRGGARAAAPVAQAVNHAQPIFHAAQQAGALTHQAGMGHALAEQIAHHAMARAAAAGAPVAAAARSTMPGFGTRIAEHGIKEVFGTLGGMARDAHKLHLEAALAPKPMNPIHGFLGNAAVVAGGTALMAGGSALMGSIQLNMSYKKMLQLYPELAREQPERVKNYFDAIAAGSASTASQPMVVGSLIKRMLNYDGFDPATFKELVGTEANFSKIHAGNSHEKLMFGGLDTLHRYGIGTDPHR